ncbi:Protein of unknown function [Gryllus bimaculatus]|nr:Protein of unknown function [Gryllus bimaculatus]
MKNSDSKYILGKSSGTYDALPSTNLFSPSCDEYQHGFAPFILSSPSGKLESSDTLLPQSSWPSMFYYTPAAIPLPAAFFDYALLPGVPTATEFIPTGPDETVLIDIPNAPGVYNRNDFQVTCNGERTSIYSAENAFRDCEEGVGYVTLHIPASTMSTVNTYSFPNENGKSSQSLKTEQFLDKTGKESPEGSIKADMYDENKIKYKVSGIEEDEKQKDDVKNECSQENSDELKRQNLTITGMPMQEPIVISQNERICVIMDAPTSDTDYSGF